MSRAKKKDTNPLPNEKNKKEKKKKRDHLKMSFDKGKI